MVGGAAKVGGVRLRELLSLVPMPEATQYSMAELSVINTEPAADQSV